MTKYLQDVFVIMSCHVYYSWVELLSSAARTRFTLAGGRKTSMLVST